MPGPEPKLMVFRTATGIGFDAEQFARLSGYLEPNVAGFAIADYINP